MKLTKLDRRTFNQLTAAAFGGMVTGTMIGCAGGQGDGGGADTGAGDDTSAAGSDTSGDMTAVAANDWMGDTHVCRGLNACNGKGSGGDNACAGQGTCATAAAHSCHEANDCKYQGGCGESVGNNACKGQGECAVPLGDQAWQKARESFEAAMAAAGKEFGEAPPKSDG